MGTTIGLSALAAIDLVVAQGADFTATMQYVNTDVSAWTAHAQLRQYPGGPTWADLTKGNGITLASDGTITLHIPAATTGSTGWTDYRQGVWDLFLTDGSGVATRFAAGAVTVIPEVTR